MSARELQSEQQVLDKWRQKGPIGKLHNIVKFIRRSSQRREEFLRTALNDKATFGELDHLMVISDNATRWNSAYHMIDRGLKLRNRIDIYCGHHQRPVRAPRAEDGDNGSVKDDTLTSDDWAILSEIASVLRIFMKATTCLEGRAKLGSHGAALEVLPTFYGIYNDMKRHRDRYGALNNPDLDYGSMEHVHLFHSLNAAINKLDKYKELLSQSPIYVAATVMNPCFRWLWYQQNAPEDLICKKTDVKQIWENHYDSPLSRPSSRSTSSAAPNSMEDYSFISFFQPPQQQNEPQDAYTEYCETNFKVKTHVLNLKRSANSGSTVYICLWLLWRSTLLLFLLCRLNVNVYSAAPLTLSRTSEAHSKTIQSKQMSV